MTINEFLMKFNYLMAKTELMETTHNNLLIKPVLSYAITDQIYPGTSLLTQFSSWMKHTTEIGAMLQ